MTMEQKSHDLAIAYLTIKYSNKEITTEEIFSEYNQLIEYFMNQATSGKPKAKVHDKSKYGF